MKQRTAAALKGKKGRLAQMRRMREAKKLKRSIQDSVGQSSVDHSLPSTSAAVDATSNVSSPVCETTEEKDTSFSASHRKMRLFTDSEQNSSEQNSQQRLPTTICELDCFSALLEGVACKACGEPGLVLNEGKGSKSFSIHLQLWCPICEANIGETYTSSRSSQFHQVNRQVVASSVSNGMSHASLHRFCEGIGLPSMQFKTYYSHIKKIYDNTVSLAQSFLQQSRERVKEFYRENHPEAIKSDGIIDIAVSYDGKWQKRGHTSKLGCGAVIELETGLVIDYHVMSTYCQICSTIGKRKNQNEDQLKERQLHHKDSGLCTQNYSGTSGGMKVEAALILWKRSVDQGFRYTTLLGDGDTKTFLALSTAKPYAGIDVKKEECVNHVAKRLGTGLRNLKATLTKKGVRIGGRSKGSLTDAKIALLQSYYTKAVRSCNNSIDEMRSAIYAGLMHSASTNDEPQHNFCPDGEDSWCWYKKDIARGVSRPVRSDGQQSTYLSKDVVKHVKEVYDRLTEKKLLDRCLLGRTQNPNESLHSVIWSRCPKHLWSGYKRVFMAVTLAVGEFNMGSKGLQEFLKACRCTVHETSVLLGRRRDKRRLKSADEAEKSVQKRKREARCLNATRNQQAMEEKEGGPSYSAGQC